MDLHDKVVLITGGSHGLGLALARRFAQEDTKLVLCARSKEKLDRAAEDLARTGAEVFTAACDVSDRLQVEALVTAALDHFSRIDVLVNNAGIIHVGPIDATTIEDFEEAMRVMFWGTVCTTMAVLPHMRGRERRIVNITSIGAKVSVSPPRAIQLRKICRGCIFRGHGCRIMRHRSESCNYRAGTHAYRTVPERAVQERRGRRRGVV